MPKYDYEKETVNDAKNFIKNELPKYDDFELQDIVTEDGQLKDGASDAFEAYLDENQVSEPVAKEHLEGNDEIAQKTYQEFGYEPIGNAKKDYFIKSNLAPQAMNEAVKDPDVAKSLGDLTKIAYPEQSNGQEEKQFEQLSLDLDGLDDSTPTKDNPSL